MYALLFLQLGALAWLAARGFTNEDARTRQFLVALAAGLVPGLWVLAVGPGHVWLSAASAAIAGSMIWWQASKLSAAYREAVRELRLRREQLCAERENHSREMEGAAAIVSHELRNPLASIKCLASHLSGRITDTATVQRLNVISLEADRLNGVVDRFESMSRPLTALTLAPVRPLALAQELRLLLDARLLQAKVPLEITGDPRVEIEADQDKLLRALLHLVLNATQASPAGQAVAIDIRGGAPGGATIEIVDRGQGTNAQELGRLRKPFSSTRSGGAGLGVAVARALIEQHGGRLSFRSAVGRGTTVTIYLPTRPADEHLAPDDVLAAMKHVEHRD